MKILVVEPGPNFSVQDVYRGWLDGFQQLGLDARGFLYADRLNFYEQGIRGSVPEADKMQAAANLASESLRATCMDWWPDVVVIVSAFFVNPYTYDVLRARGIKVVTLLTESPYEDPNQYLIAARADLAVVNDPTNLDTFRQHQPATFYVPHGYDPRRHSPGPSSADLKCDFGWVGTAYPSRRRFFSEVDWSGIDVLLGGNWQDLDDWSPLNDYLITEKELCLENSDAVELYRSCKASANLYRREGDQHDGWSMGPREVELAACGTFFLRDPRPEGDEILPMLPTFEGPNDFGDKLRWWLTHDDEREDAASQARAAVADRTFINNCRFVLSRL